MQAELKESWFSDIVYVTSAHIPWLDMSYDKACHQWYGNILLLPRWLSKKLQQVCLFVCFYWSIVDFQCCASFKYQFSSVAQSCPTLCNPRHWSMPGLPVHRQLPEFTQTHVHQVGDAIHPSHPLSSPSPPALNSFPASGSFQMSQFFTSGGQSIGVSGSASVFPMNIQGWFPLGWTGWISLQSKRLSRVFSNTTVQKHQFFGAQLSL